MAIVLMQLGVFKKNSYFYEFFYSIFSIANKIVINKNVKIKETKIPINKLNIYIKMIPIIIAVISIYGIYGNISFIFASYYFLIFIISSFSR